MRLTKPYVGQVVEHYTNNPRTCGEHSTVYTYSVKVSSYIVIT